MMLVRKFKPLTIWPELLIVLYLRNPLLIPYAAGRFLCLDDDCGLEFLLFVYSSLCLTLGAEKRNGMMSMLVVYDSSYSLTLFSRPFFGVLITVTVKPNVSSIIGPRFGSGVGN